MKCEICGTTLRAELAITEPGWIIFHECIVKGNTEQETIDNYEMQNIKNDHYKCLQKGGLLMWKKINEHCPYEGQRIIAYTINNDIALGYWVSDENALCDQADGVSSWKWGFTHWMPLPEPPTAVRKKQSTLTT